jgi:hypothetical protein
VTEINDMGGMAVKSYRKELWFNTPARVAFINITPQVDECLRGLWGKGAAPRRFEPSTAIERLERSLVDSGHTPCPSGLVGSVVISGSN